MLALVWSVVPSGFAGSSVVHAARLHRELSTHSFAMIRGTVAINRVAKAALVSVLTLAHGSLPKSSYYAISSVQKTGSWWLVSMVGVNRIDPQTGWKLDDANW